MTRLDAIVIGAGPAGSTAALLLARAGWSIAIVEKSEFPRRKVCGEFISAPGVAQLARMGIVDVLERAGPEVREVAVYAGERIAAAPMPKLEGEIAYGRALGREHLDTMLLESAAAAGAKVYQPWRVAACERAAEGYACAIETERGGVRQTLTAPLVLAAHGSWDTGRLPLPGTPRRVAPSDLLAFKANFDGTALPPHRVSVVAFPGGYGGLVHTNGARVSFSCCIRRDALAQCRSSAPGSSAAAAVLAHVMRHSRGVREALGDAHCQDQWLAVGPLRPGIRRSRGDGHFALGNARGEAHPIIGDGISMAMQSASLLCERLTRSRSAIGNGYWDALAQDYDAAYRRNFGQRMRAAALFAALAMRPKAGVATAHLFAMTPGLLAYAARRAGKVRPLRGSA